MYRLGQVGTGTIAHDLNRWWAKLRGKPDPYQRIGSENNREESGGDYVWALQDINLEVQQGQILGIIGRNGAGKSTLLKLLSRVTAPTNGSIKVRGRMASLLEVGTGFHPELTGRENIFLNGAILGMSRSEIKARFDEIVDFSGCAKYVDTPVKRYSSGMYVRLAFAVAAHLEPDILIVDEVLAVGDADFQARCIGKMKDVSERGGRTILFVSHNMASLRQLCPQSCLMVNGKLNQIGETSQVIQEYLTVNAAKDRSVVFEGMNHDLQFGLKPLSIRILDSMGRVDARLTSETDISIVVQYELKASVKNLRVQLTLHASDGTHILSSSDFNFQGEERDRAAGVYESICTIPRDFLNLGRYIAQVDFEVPFVASIFSGLEVGFEVAELAINHLGPTSNPRPPGAIHPSLHWDVNTQPIEAVS